MVLFNLLFTFRLHNGPTGLSMMLKASGETGNWKSISMK